MSFLHFALPSDFGFAQYMSPWDEKSVLRGSPLYMAPEMVCRRQYDSRVDLWSVGVILYGEEWHSGLFVLGSGDYFSVIYAPLQILVICKYSACDGMKWVSVFSLLEIVLRREV